MTNKQTILSLVCVLFIIVSGCDPGVKYSKIIDNQSDYELIMILEYEGHDTPPDTSNIYSGSEIVVYNYDHIGRVSEYENCKSEFIHTIRLKVKNNDSLVVSVDPNNLQNWNYYLLEKGINGSGECECRMIVSNDNIEK
jgi:hypothetical protein